MTDHEDKSGAESPDVDDSVSDSSEQRPSAHPGPQREDEYADHAVHALPKRPVRAPPEEKKVVITSREAETLKVKHEDYPRLAERLAAERGAHASDAEEWVEPPRRRKAAQDESSTAWVDDPPTFDPDELPRADPSKPERRKPSKDEPPSGRSTAGLVFALLLLAAASAFAFLVVSGKIDLPELTAGAEGSVAPLPAPTPTAAPSIAPTASARTPAPSATLTASTPVKGSAAPSASASGKRRGKRPVKPPPVAPPPSATVKSENDLFER